MDAEALKAAVLAEPFRPVQIVMSNGATYEVNHPDGIIIRRKMAAVAVGDMIHTISNEHVNQVVPLTAV